MDAPIERRDAFLPIEDHGLIGDGASAALVGRDGSIDWLCAPRFDAPPLFCGILDPDRGGSFRIAPVGAETAEQTYEDGTGVLTTRIRGRAGTLEVTDAMALRAGADLREDVGAERGELLRRAEALDRPVDAEIDLRPRARVRVEGSDRDWRLLPPGHGGPPVSIHSSHPLPGLRSTLTIDPGRPLEIVLRWGRGERAHRRPSLEQRLTDTLEAWRRWTANVDFEGPHEGSVRRSAITLKLLDHFANGAIVAAPTSSLPESPGGSRNWDYRYAWIRDAAFSVYALRRIGLPDEAWGFLGWVLDAVEAHGGRPRVLYDLDGAECPPERVDPDLRGYLDSRPVRWGNGAREQVQHDVYGEILDCAHQWVAGGGTIGRPLWDRLRPLIDAAGKEWQDPDHGIWEVRSGGEAFTYSAAMCQVALDRGARLAERLGLPGDTGRWRTTADRIRATIVERSWDPEVGALTGHLHGGPLDAAVLSLPLRRVIPADHPRMAATADTIAERLSAGDGLLYRYLPEDFPDGIGDAEGAFLLCSFWLVDVLALQGRLEEAEELFAPLCGRANHVGLLAEQIDPGSGRFLGNFPQAFSHVGLISAAFHLAREGRRREESGSG